MAGGIILSRRLERMQEAARNFGDTFAEIGEQTRRRKMEEEDRGIRNKAAATSQQVADLQLGEFQRRDAARQEADSLSGMLTDFGAPGQNIDMPSEDALPGFQPMQSPRPMVESSDGLKDRLRAAWMNADAKSRGESAAFTVEDVKRKRQEESMKTQQTDLALKKGNKELEMLDKEFGLQDRRTKVAEGQLALEEKKLNAELERIAKGGMDPEKAVAIEAKLRGEFLNQNKVFMDVRDAWSRVQASNDDAAGDLALIFNYMKMLDPGSTVREGEFANAQNAAGIPDRVRNMYNNLMKGERLGLDQRKQFKGQAGKLFEAQKSIYTNSAKSYMSLAADYGVEPTRVVRDLSDGVQGPGAPAGGSPVPKPAAAGGMDRRSLAQQALNDPEATEAERAQARRILGM